jgi:hypothetical protein
MFKCKLYSNNCQSYNPNDKDWFNYRTDYVAPGVKSGECTHLAKFSGNNKIPNLCKAKTNSNDCRNTVVYPGIIRGSGLF